MIAWQTVVPVPELVEQLELGLAMTVLQGLLARIATRAPSLAALVSSLE